MVQTLSIGSRSMADITHNGLDMYQTKLLQEIMHTEIVVFGNLDWRTSMLKILKRLFEPVFNIRYIFKEDAGKSTEEIFQEMWDKKTQAHIDKLLRRNNETD